ncbi:MAG: hypothetical protein FLDDKLPJ_03128 [Phycisphaerae bacterium]|nr:hypothetical protein [Phycisphaerae bacterium]
MSDGSGENVRAYMPGSMKKQRKRKSRSSGKARGPLRRPGDGGSRTGGVRRPSRAPRVVTAQGCGTTDQSARGSASGVLPRKGLTGAYDSAFHGVLAGVCAALILSGTGQILAEAGAARTAVCGGGLAACAVGLVLPRRIALLISARREVEPPPAIRALGSGRPAKARADATFGWMQAAVLAVTTGLLAAVGPETASVAARICDALRSGFLWTAGSAATRDAALGFAAFLPSMLALGGTLACLQRLTFVQGMPVNPPAWGLAGAGLCALLPFVDAAAGVRAAALPAMALACHCVLRSQRPGRGVARRFVTLEDVGGTSGARRGGVLDAACVATAGVGTGFMWAGVAADGAIAADPGTWAGGARTAGLGIIVCIAALGAHRAARAHRAWDMFAALVAASVVVAAALMIVGRPEDRALTAGYAAAGVLGFAGWCVGTTRVADRGADPPRVLLVQSAWALTGAAAGLVWVAVSAEGGRSFARVAAGIGTLGASGAGALILRYRRRGALSAGLTYP